MTDQIKHSSTLAGGVSSLKPHELLTVAVYLAGGEAREVDTEDVAVTVNEIAPGRCCWRKYPEQINIEIVRAFLSDAKKKKDGAYLSGSGSTGWLLTQSGFQFAIHHVAELKNGLPRVERLTAVEKARKRN